MTLSADSASTTPRAPRRSLLRAVFVVLVVGALAVVGYGLRTEIRSFVSSQVRNALPLPEYHAGNVIATYALSGPETGPAEAEDAISQGRYVSGGYQVLTKLEDRNTRISARVSQTNLRVEADIVFATPTASGLQHHPYAGLICRAYRLTADQGRYLFAVDPEGNSSIVRIRNADSGDIAELAKSSNPSDAVHATTSNHIQAECLQDKDSVALVLSVNGIQLLRAVDSDPRQLFGAGAWGFEAYSGSQAGFTTIFSNIRVTEMLAGR